MSARVRRFVQELGTLGELVDALQPRKAPPGGDWTEVAPGVWKRDPRARVPNPRAQIPFELQQQFANARYIKEQFEELGRALNANRTRQR
jgi:hypothetical protein